MNIAQLKTTDECPSKQSVVLFCWRNGKVRWMSVAADFSLSLSASVETFATTLTLHTQNCICTVEQTKVESFNGGYCAIGANLNIYQLEASIIFVISDSCLFTKGSLLFGDRRFVFNFVFVSLIAFV